MKYKLINSVTKKETICDKVTIDGFDYYVGDEIIEEGWKGTAYKKDVKGQIFNHFYTTNEWYKDAKRVIATTNPNIDIPKVVDEVEVLSEEWYNKKGKISPRTIEKNSFKAGYTKSQETHPNSDEDMVEFGKYCIRQFALSQNRDESFTKRLLPEWREQKSKTVSQT